MKLVDKLVNKVKQHESIYKFLSKTSKNIFQKKKLTIDSNEKLQGILGISLPNELLRLHFIRWYKEMASAEDKTLELEKLYNYMVNNESCTNCENCIKKCYNNALYYFRPTKAAADLRNLYMLLFDTENFINQCVKAFNNCRVVRLNVSGDINPIIWQVYKQVIKKCRYTKFYLYTKNYDYLEEIKNEIPKNLIINVSIWDNNTGILKKYDFSMFNIYHTTSKNNQLATTPENRKLKIVDCSQGNCLECGNCFRKNQYIITDIRG